jgi:hypothetical protein
VEPEIEEMRVAEFCCKTYLYRLIQVSWPADPVFSKKPFLARFYCNTTHLNRSSRGLNPCAPRHATGLAGTLLWLAQSPLTALGNTARGTDGTAGAVISRRHGQNSVLVAGCVRCHA